MSFIQQPSLEQIRARITKTLKDGIQLDMSTQESKKFLKRHVKQNKSCDHVCGYQ